MSQGAVGTHVIPTCHNQVLVMNKWQCVIPTCHNHVLVMNKWQCCSCGVRLYTFVMLDDLDVTDCVFGCKMRMLVFECWKTVQNFEISTIIFKKFKNLYKHKKIQERVSIGSLWLICFIDLIIYLLVFLQYKIILLL